MKKRFRSLAALAVVLLASAPVRAHFPFLVHDAGLSATTGPVGVTYAMGHPYELTMEPAKRPERVVMVDAQGRATNLTAALRPTLFRGDPTAPAWQIEFTPGRGDSLIALDSAPEVNETQATLYREYVKVHVHRTTQKGWTNRSGQPLEIVPLTRPYGLKPGMVFTGRLLHGENPVADADVYFEPLNDRRPAKEQLPAEPLVTFAVRTDREGRFVLALPDAGWWVVGAYVDDLGTVQHAGKTYRHEGFAGLWVKVEPR